MTVHGIERVIHNGLIACREKWYMPKNVIKADTRECDFEKLFELLVGEVEELRIELIAGNVYNMRHEAADVANFAMAIIDSCDKAINENIKETGID